MDSKSLIPTSNHNLRSLLSLPVAAKPIKQYSKKTAGAAFNELEMAAVWNKALSIPGYDLRLWRRDACGAPIYRSNYGKTVETGWEIDHINPVSNGGGDNLANLQALQWENNRLKADKLTNLYCVVPKRGA